MVNVAVVEHGLTGCLQICRLAVLKQYRKFGFGAVLLIATLQCGQIPDLDALPVELVDLETDSDPPKACLSADRFS